ncbi:MAG: hypothetical protein WDW38_004699 [Sanguina aurantia]
MSGKQRFYVFTQNNPETHCPGGITWPTNVKYAVWQLEVGEEGTPHWQGYLEFKSPVTFARACKILPHGRFAIRKGTQAQARDYCMKKDPTYREGPWEHGLFEAEAQGKRDDLDKFRTDVVDGATVSELLMAHPGVMARHPHFLNTVREAFLGQKDEDTPPIITCYWGPTGSGKTHRSKAECSEEVFYLRRLTSGKWWAGYTGQTHVIIDEVDKGYITPTDLLALLDKGAPMIEDKGITMTFRATHIWLTANAHPAHWMPKSGRESRAGMLRRIMQYGRIEHIPCRTDTQAREDEDYYAIIDAADNGHAVQPLCAAIEGRRAI